MHSPCLKATATHELMKYSAAAIDFCQTSSARGDPLDLFDQALLLDMIYIGTPQLHGGVYVYFFYKVSFLKHYNVQILETMPPAFFLPVGQPFVEHQNNKFGKNWGGDEFGGYCFAYFVYLCVVSQHNLFHPKFHRSAPAALQARTLSTNAKYYF